MKDMHHSNETKERIRQKLMGHPVSEESRIKMREASLRQWKESKIPQGMTGKHHTKESNEKNSLAHIGKPGYWTGKKRSIEDRTKFSNSHKGQIPWMKGKCHTQESKDKNSRANKGRKAWNKGKPLSEEHHRNIIIATKKAMNRPDVLAKNIASHNSKEYLKKAKERTALRWQDPNFVMKVQMGYHKKTRPEQQIDTLLQQLYPNEFAYNGRFDCEIMIGGLVPDFPNVNGQKKVIEVFGSFRFKNKNGGFREHTEQEIAEKTARYAKYGYGSLFIWDYELKNDRKGVVQKIVDFVGKPPHDSFEGFK
jgi:very-short-patch-repair endonuclease